MKRRWSQSLLFFLSGFLSIGLGFILSIQFIGRARSEGLANTNSVEQTNNSETEAENENSSATSNSHSAPELQGGNFPPESGNTATPGATSNSKSESEPGFVELASPKKIPDAEATSILHNSRTIVAPDGYTYDPTGKRDPFAPFIGNKVIDRIKPEENFEILEPLQKYELNKLEILAILWDVSHPRAMIKDPSGEIHLVTRGQKIGRNDGYIVAIREGELVVMESFDNGSKIVKEPKIMSLKK